MHLNLAEIFYEKYLINIMYTTIVKVGSVTNRSSRGLALRINKANVVTVLSNSAKSSATTEYFHLIFETQ